MKQFDPKMMRLDNIMLYLGWLLILYYSFKVISYWGIVFIRGGV